MVSNGDYEHRSPDTIIQVGYGIGTARGPPARLRASMRELGRVPREGSFPLHDCHDIDYTRLLPSPTPAVSLVSYYPAIL